MIKNLIIFTLIFIFIFIILTINFFIRLFYNKNAIIFFTYKPSKEIFDFALQKAWASLDKSIMIGDNLDADIQGGINAVMDTIFVNHINAQPHIHATHEVFHLKELENIL